MKSRSCGSSALTSSTSPILTPDESPAPDAIEAAGSNPLGTETFELVSVRSVHQPDSHRGHKMEARGLLYREPDYAELNLTSLEMVGPDCTN